MKIFTELRREHELIDHVAGAMRTWASRAVHDHAPLEDGRTFIRFFEVYTGGLHHEREEAILFPTVWNQLGLRADSPPITVTIDTHHELAALLACMKSLIDKKRPSAREIAELEQYAVRYTRILWLHIDGENSVLFPEIEERLRHAGIHELPTRTLTAGEQEVMKAGEELLHRYPPSDDPEIVRGEGCAMCSAYLATCAGIEREWWNEWEWEELGQRVAST